MQDPQQIRQELERRGQAESLRRLAGSIDALEAQQAVQSGDQQALQRLLQTVLSTREGRELAESVKKMVEK